MEEPGTPNRGMGRPSALRRHYIINPRFQWKCTGVTALAVFLVSLTTGIAVYLFQYREAQFSSALMHARLTIVLFAATFAVVMAACFALWSVFLTHRICGPLFVMGRCFDTLIDGGFPKQRPLRAKDEFREFHGHFWRAVDAMRERKEAELDSLRQVLSAVRSVAETDAQTWTNLNTVEARVKALVDDDALALGLTRDDVPESPVTNRESPPPIVPRHAETYA